MKPKKLSNLPKKPFWANLNIHWIIGGDRRCKHYQEYQAVQCETKEQTFYICCGCLRTWQAKKGE